MDLHADVRRRAEEFSREPCHHEDEPELYWAGSCQRCVNSLLRSFGAAVAREAAKVADDFESADCGDYYHDYCHCGKEANENISAAIEALASSLDPGVEP